MTNDAAESGWTKAMLLDDLAFYESAAHRMAKRIDELTADNAALRAALKQIVALDYRGNEPDWYHIARAALREPPTAFAAFSNAAILAAERRATVERIRAALEARHQNARAMYPLEIHAILDAEAERPPQRDERHRILDDLFPKPTDR